MCKTMNLDERSSASCQTTNHPAAAFASRAAYGKIQSRTETMCRNIKTLANFEPPATDDEIRASALQFVRKLSGSTRPSRANEVAFDQADRRSDCRCTKVDSLAQNERAAEKPRRRGPESKGTLAPAVRVNFAQAARRGAPAGAREWCGGARRPSTARATSAASRPAAPPRVASADSASP